MVSTCAPPRSMRAFPWSKNRQHPLEVVAPPPAQPRDLHDVAPVVDARDKRMAGVDLGSGAPLRRPRTHVQHRLVRQPEVVAQQVDGDDGRGLAPPRGMLDHVGGAAQLLAEVRPETLDDRRRVGLLDLDEHLPLAAPGGAHAGREVHAEQGERRLHGVAFCPPLPLARGRQLLWTQFQRFDVEPGDTADEEPRRPIVLHQVLEGRVVDRVGDLHTTISTAPSAARQLADAGCILNRWSAPESGYPNPILSYPPLSARSSRRASSSSMSAGQPQAAATAASSAAWASASHCGRAL